LIVNVLPTGIPGVSAAIIVLAKVNSYMLALALADITTKTIGAANIDRIIDRIEFFIRLHP
jgi:hypothetical protein